jgi:hypothetical protein
MISAQTATSPGRFIRLSEDNDGINAWFKGSDWGYTNGTGLDYFGPRKKQRPKIHPSLSRFSRANATNGWGIRQLMITPQKTRPFIPDKNDYPYAGALIAVHTRHRAAPYHKMNMQSEWIAGLMGPASFAEQTQVFLHRLIGDPRPNGWDYQLPADLLLNYNFMFEKQVAGKNKLILVMGSNGFAGTLSDGLSVYTLLRFQKNLDYFSGLSPQQFPVHRQKAGIAVAVKPVAGFVFYNALLQGGLFNRHSPVHDGTAKSGTALKRNILHAGLDIMLHFSFRQFSLSFTQKIQSPDFRNYNGHKVGNISLSYGW